MQESGAGTASWSPPPSRRIRYNRSSPPRVTAPTSTTLRRNTAGDLCISGDIEPSTSSRPARVSFSAMNILLWVLQLLAALLYTASGVMKVFMLDKVSEGVASFAALPRQAWLALGILELVCTAGLIVPDAL